MEKNYNKSLVIDFNCYINDVDSTFVIDTEDGMTKLLSCIEKIHLKDIEYKIFCVTYPKLGNNKIYSDNVLIVTQLSKEYIEDIMSEYPEIEPYYINEMTYEEKSEVEWADVSLDTLESIPGYKIFSLYWD